MKLSSEERDVLAVFKKHKVRAGHYLPIGAMIEMISDQPQASKDIWKGVLNDLIEHGFIFKDAAGHGLTEKGSEYITLYFEE